MRAGLPRRLAAAPPHRNFIHSALLSIAGAMSIAAVPDAMESGFYK